MAIGDFEDKRICYGNWYAESSVATLIATTDTWTRLNCANLVSDIQNNISFDANAGSRNGEWEFITSGKYIIQMRMAFSGGTNDSYSLRWQYSYSGGTEDEVVANSEITFTTKATNTWEVQNLMIVDFPLRYTGTDGLWGETKQGLYCQVKNNTDASNLTLENGDFTFFKIG
tara:strand:+ start:1571 stop:2086 length:516 start_codon:yes stop_codon:yes gene_type:complete